MKQVFDFEAASLLSKGRRSYQEDAILSDFSAADRPGLVVLSDGMGGHTAGDVASNIVVSEVFQTLSTDCRGDYSSARCVASRLREAMLIANARLKTHVANHPDTHGMGATLLCCLLEGHYLHWVSVGDSPLYLFRAGALYQLNEDHSMAPQIDFLVKSGLMSPEEAERHPDRNTLTSVLYGADIPRVDCPEKPLEMHEGDMLIIASDGIQFLRDDAIEALLQRNCHRTCCEIVDLLMSEISNLGDPEQDNTSMMLVKLQHAEGGLAHQDMISRLRCVG